MKPLKLLALALALTLLFSASCFAFPQSIWAPLGEYEAALASGDDQKITQIGETLVSIMEAEPDSSEKTTFLAGKYEQLSRAYERLGQYERAVYYYQKYIPFGQAMGWTDGVLLAQRKIPLLTPSLDVYYEGGTDTVPYYGAKFEPASGVIYGATYSNDPRIGEINDAKIRAQFPKAESTYLIYLEYGEDINALGRYKVIFDTAREGGKAVLLAVNTYNDMANIQNEGAYVQSIVNFLAGYPTVPVFFRFANEMNVGPNGTNPASYVAAFRFVADIARSAPNIAMVWAPNDVSAIDRNLADYWPGNEYVDWVGVSLYTMKYWNGLDNQGGHTDDANTYFIAGYFANPIKRLEPIMEFMTQNGIEKPIMVAEGGDAHTLRQQGEDTTSWAMVQLNRRYSELIRKYPNLKLICYFNTSIAEEAYDFSLFGSPQMNALYNQLVENPYFLSSYNASAGFAYRPLKNADFETGQSLKLSAVCYWPKALFTDVEYILNGQSLGKTNQTPYEVTTPPLANGVNTLTVRAFTDGVQVLEKSFTLNAAQQVKVKLDGEYVPFYDVFPQIIDGRTMIPARGVFTAMGAQVGWDGASQKVTVVKDDTTIELVIGSGQMWVNGAFVNLDVPAQIVNDRTLIPLRAVSEALGCAVDWDNDARCVVITQ